MGEYLVFLMVKIPLVIQSPREEEQSRYRTSKSFLCADAWFGVELAWKYRSHGTMMFPRGVGPMLALPGPHPA